MGNKRYRAGAASSCYCELHISTLLYVWIVALNCKEIQHHSQQQSELHKEVDSFDWELCLENEFRARFNLDSSSRSRGALADVEIIISCSEFLRFSTMTVPMRRTALISCILIY